MPTYVLSAHAKAVMAERSINLEWVERVLAKPETIEADKEHHDLRHALGRIEEHQNRVLRVVYNWTAEPVRVVTAYFDRAMRYRL
jgi:hypothetical protein